MRQNEMLAGVFIGEGVLEVQRRPIPTLPEQDWVLFDIVAEVLREVGYAGAVGMEAFPVEDSYQALDRFRTVFMDS
ncbi:MAG: hypothetical protein HYR94_14670 [Chloroflexi bacterium]|nr:hypothetical protein [Chloroflexota bacterium]